MGGGGETRADSCYGPIAPEEDRGRIMSKRNSSSIIGERLEEKTEAKT